MAVSQDALGIDLELLDRAKKGVLAGVDPATLEPESGCRTGLTPRLSGSLRGAPPAAVMHSSAGIVDSSIALTPSAEGGWASLDHVPVSACAVSTFRHLDDVPDSHAEAWALANVDVLEFWAQAEEAFEQVRGLKWILVLRDILLLRLPPQEAAGRAELRLLTHGPVATWFFGDVYLAERHRPGIGPGLPLALAVEHFADSLSGFPGALRVGT